LPVSRESALVIAGEITGTGGSATGLPEYHFWLIRHLPPGREASHTIALTLCQVTWTLGQVSAAPQAREPDAQVSMSRHPMHSKLVETFEDATSASSQFESRRRKVCSENIAITLTTAF
jgi:hypothetical protein